MKEIRIRKPKTISLENPPKLVIITTDQKYLIDKVKILWEDQKIWKKTILRFDVYSVHNVKSTRKIIFQFFCDILTLSQLDVDKPGHETTQV